MGSKWDKLTRNLMEPTSEADIKRLEEYGNSLAGRRSKLPDLSQLSKFGTEVQEWHYEWLSQAYRVLQPGGVVKAFAATRTYHRLAAAMEDAGFVDIHLEAWTYGSGFPKSHNVGKSIDALLLTGNTNSVSIKAMNTLRPGEGVVGVRLPNNGIMSDDFRQGSVTNNPATLEGEKWNGWGTALKPAWEPVVIGRKP